MKFVFAVVIFLASGLSAYLCCRRTYAALDRKPWIIALLVAWTVFLIVPVQVLASLELAGVIERVTIPALTWLELVIAIAISGIVCILPKPATAARGPRAQEQRGPLPALVRAAAILVGAAYLLAAIDLCTSFPAGSDALAYHLPLAVRWLQEGSLRLPASGTWRFSLPGNGEILSMLALSTGRQSLAPLFNWVSCALLALSLYVFTTRFVRSTRTHSVASVLIALSLPPVFFQAFSAYVDLFGTSCMLAAVVLFLHRFPPASEATTPRLSGFVLFLSALACGISLGTKPIYCVYGGFFSLCVVITLCRERSTHRRPMPVLVALVVSGILLPSAFWFVRDWRATGNPFYPLPVQVAGHIVFPGYESFPTPYEPRASDDRPGGDTTFGDQKYVRSRAEWFIYPWTEWIREAGTFPTSYGDGSGAGAAFSTFIPLGIAFLVYNFRSGRKRGPALTQLLLLWLVLLAVWAVVLHRVLRFGLPIWVVGCIFAVPLLAAIEPFFPKTIGALLLLSLASTFAVSSLVPLHSLGGRIAKHRWSRAAFYGYPPAIDDLPKGSRVLNYTGILELNFALAGKMLSNRVVPSFEAPKEVTQEYLARQRVDYIVEAARDSESPATAPPALPLSIAAKFDEYKSLGTTWFIYEVVRH